MLVGVVLADWESFGAAGLGVGVGTTDVGVGVVDGLLLAVSITLGVDDPESVVGVDDALESGVEDGEPLSSGEMPALWTSAAGGVAGTIRTIGAVVPSDTVSCSAAEAKECHANVVSDVTGVGTRIVNPLASRSVTNSPVAVWSSGVSVTIG